MIERLSEWRPGRATSAAIGLLGSALVAWGSTSSEYSFGPQGWPHPAVAAFGRTLLWPAIPVVVGVLLLTLAWWAARPGEATLGVRTAWWTWAAWSAPLLLVPPVLSADATLYADTGYQVARGLNPYVVGLGGAGGPFAAHIDPLWQGGGVAYPPLTLLVNALVVSLSGTHPYWSVVAMRLPSLLGVVLLGASLIGIARQLGRRPDVALWWGLLNPLLVLHFVGGAHNDALMVGVAMSALWLAVRFPAPAVRWLVAPALVGVAMALKQQGGLMVLAVAGVPVAGQLASLPLVQRVVRWGVRTAGVTVVAAATFAGISWASGLGVGWTKWLSIMGAAGTLAPFGLLSQFGGLAIAQLGGDPGPWRFAIAVLSTLTLLTVLVWLLLRFSDRPLAAVAWVSLAVATLGQALHPWYLPWSLALLGLVDLSPRQRRWLVRGVLAYVLATAVQTAGYFKVRL